MFTMLIVFFVVIILGIYLNDKFDSDVAGFLAVCSLLGVFILPVMGFVSYLNHASDIGTIRGQSGVISVYEERVASLEERLNKFNYPKGGSISLNADSPVAAIVSSLTGAESELALAKRQIADAKVSIERRKAGPFSSIVSLVGEE